MFRTITKNFTLYSFAFVLSLYLHNEGFANSKGYGIYYIAFILSWVIASLLSRKFKQNNNDNVIGKLYTYTISFFLMLGILALIIYKFDLTGVSRFVILNSLIISYFVEIFSLYHKNKNNFKFRDLNLTYSIRAFIFEVILFNAINLYIIYNLRGNIALNFDNFVLFMSLYISWFAGSFIGYQFHPAFRRRDYWSFKWQYLKSYIIILALATFFGFVIRLQLQEVKFIAYGIVIYSVISFVSTSFFYYVLKHRMATLSVASFPVKGIFGDILLNEDPDAVKKNHRTSVNNNSEVSGSKFKNFSLKRYPGVYEFLDSSIDLRSIEYSSSVIIKSDSVSNIDYLPEETLKLLLNLEKVNNFHYTNEYLAEVNRKLAHGGIFAGHFETTYLRHQNFLKKYPYYFAQLFYFLDFILNRVFSKISLTKRIYNIITGGAQKVLPLAEGLGRLYFSGFEVINLKIIDNTMFFVAKKIKDPITDVTPSTGLLFKMRRLGKDGKPIFVYKIRTMHPYSEYLQEFIYNKFNLQEGGKFNNDFRVTYWGAILRKFWLDELPMPYNLLKGDLKLVGPRPLSQHYFNLYDEDLKRKRLKCKPGLIPPFYADNPKTLDEIMKSEKKYLALYNKDPLRTDAIYFVHCINNILFKGARSK